MTASHVLFAGLTAGCLLVGCGGPRDVDQADDEPIASSSAAWFKNALTAEEARAVLQAIDDICGDTWCEGDYNFRFRRLTCSAAAQTCNMSFQIFPREGVASERPVYWRSCVTQGFTGFASLIAYDPSGYASLQPEYYDALTVCIGAVEAELR